MKPATRTLIAFLALSLGSAYGAERLRIGVSNYNLSSLSMGVAHSRGFFKEEGFDSEVIRMNPNVATTAAVTGDIDFSALIGSLIGAAIKGAPLKLVACSQDRTPIVFVARAEFKSMKDLRGKTIGIPSYGSTPDVVGRMVLRHFGVDPEKEIKAIGLGTDAARLAALKEGIVDAIIVAPPIDYEGKKLGFKVLARAGDIFTFPYNGLGTNTKKIKERPDQVKRAIRALIKANNYIRKNRDGTIRVLIEWTKTKPELAEASYDSTFPTAIRAAKQATTTIPIVMVTTQDPVTAGMVDSLARPGGNVTGVTQLARDLSGKRLELLKEAIPTLSRVGVLTVVGPPPTGISTALKEYEAAARALKIPIQSLQVVRGPNPDLEGVFREAVKGRVNALVTARNQVLTPHTKKIGDLALKNRLPSMHEVKHYVEVGGLMSYGAHDSDLFRRAAVYVDKILKGSKPADLPVEQPLKFEFVINLKTAKARNLTIPQSVLFRADTVIK